VWGRVKLGRLGWVCVYVSVFSVLQCLLKCVLRRYLYMRASVAHCILVLGIYVCVCVFVACCGVSSSVCCCGCCGR